MTAAGPKQAQDDHPVQTKTVYLFRDPAVRRRMWQPSIRFRRYKAQKAEASQEQFNKELKGIWFSFRHSWPWLLSHHATFIAAAAAYILRSLMNHSDEI